MSREQIRRLERLQIAIDSPDADALAAHVMLERRARRLRLVGRGAAAVVVLVLGASLAFALVTPPFAAPSMDAIGDASGITLHGQRQAGKNQKWALTTVRSAAAEEQTEAHGKRVPRSASVRDHPRVPAFLLQLVRDEATLNEIPFHILAGLAEDESGWRPHVEGAHGEAGLMQLKVATADWCGIDDRFDPAQSISCGARYLAHHFRTFGSWELALAAYKAGASRVPENIPSTSWAFAQRALARAEAYR